MEFIKPETFINGLSESKLKNRLFVIENKYYNQIVFYEYDINCFLLIIIDNVFHENSYFYTKSKLKTIFGRKRCISLVEFHKILNNVYLNRRIDSNIDGIFYTYNNFKAIEDKVEVFNAIKHSKLINGKDSKHVLYRDKNYYAQIIKVTSGGSVKCKLYEFTNDVSVGTENHLVYTNINNLKAVF